MKKLMYAVAIATSLALVSCGGSEAPAEEGHSHEMMEGHDHDHMEGEAAAMKYHCPMKCEGDKTYAAAGDCPKCGMALEEVK